MNKKKFDTLRKEQHITLEQLAELTGISVSTLTKISAGYIDTSFQNMCKIAHALHCSLDEFTEEDTIFSEEDRELIYKYHQLSLIGQKVAKALLDKELMHLKNHTGYGNYQNSCKKAFSIYHNL
ncbi:MAG: helix-turn-helix transcriptional regulator [Lachnospiraceae bacterium]|nr:helix-turn-helix transcriptional regulator [Lachnospiraceae bacterium]